MNVDTQAAPGMGESGLASCQVCAGSVVLRSPRVPTYIARGAVDTYECTRCALVTAFPLDVPEGLYDAIYSNADRIAGYARYARYARQVERRRDGLTYLATQEDVYWALGEILKRPEIGERSRIVDVGCGLGYVTAALRQAGFDCIGIDISEIAVTRAIERFGPWFEIADAMHPSSDRAGTFDIALVLETIEHVADPLDYLNGVARWLRPSGRIVITTPNRDSHPSAAHWRTEAPPVHLHWFTERAVVALAERLHYSVQFVDFTAFNARHAQTVDLDNVDALPNPSLDQHLSPTSSRALIRATERLHDVPWLFAAARRVRDRIRGRRQRLTTRSFALAAILEPRAGGVGVAAGEQTGREYC